MLGEIPSGNTQDSSSITSVVMVFTHPVSLNVIVAEYSPASKTVFKVKPLQLKSVPSNDQLTVTSEPVKFVGTIPIVIGTVAFGHT